MLFFEKVAGRKPAILLKYEPCIDILQRFNLDFENIFLPEHILVIALVYYQTGK